MLHILVTPTEGYAGFFAAMQLAKSAESPERYPALQLLKSLDDLDEESDEDKEFDDVDEDDEDEDEDEDEEDEDLDDDFDDEDEDEDDEDEEEDEDEDDVKPLKMEGLPTLVR